MVRVELKGHENFYGLADVLRLFYGKVSEDRTNSVVTCDGPDLEIVSEAGTEIHTYLKGEKYHWDKVMNERFPSPVIPKREVKRQLYYLLSILEGMTFPWGSLTGIRPTMVAEEEKTAEALIRDYLVRPDKAELCMRVNRNEKEVLSRQDPSAMNVYIGVPFCPSRCAYCSFVSQDIGKHLDKLPIYADSLCAELSHIGPYLKDISTVYMGGGTPTVFSDRDFEKVMDSIVDNLRLNDLTEITVEAGRADTISEYKLKVMHEHNIRRICINPQTMVDATLRRYNRAHSVEDTVRAFEAARKTGLEIINTDLIAGLNMEEPEELLYSLDRLFELDPENITLHTLYKKRRAAISSSSVLGGKSAAEGLGDERLDKTLSLAYGKLSEAGYEPYYMYRQKDTNHGLENVGFAKKGSECLYNVAMMSDRRNVAAFGAGSVSKRVFEGGRLERCSAPKDVICYMKDLRKHELDILDFFGLDKQDEVPQM